MAIVRSRPLLRFLLPLYYTHWFRAIVRPFVSSPSERTYVFIIGCYSSGTTLLDSILAAHDEISNLPSEGQSLTGQLASPEELGWHRMWHMCRDKLEISKLDKKPDASVIKKEWGFWFDSKKEFWLEKSIINSLNIDWLEEEFEHPYFIWIVRNGYAVAEGIRRYTMAPEKHPAAYPEGYPIEMCARQWVVNNQVIEEKCARVKNHIKVTYEELTGNGTETLAKILDWLPLRSKTIQIPGRFTFHRQSSPIRNMNAEEVARLSSKEITAITKVAAHMLTHHGYDILNGSI